MHVCLHQAAQGGAIPSSVRHPIHPPRTDRETSIEDPAQHLMPGQHVITDVTLFNSVSSNSDVYYLY